MRNDDLSQSGNHPTANDDYDVIPAGSGNSATGNTITGRGTISGAAGADHAVGAHVTSITGAGGGDGSSMEAAGRYGSVKIDAQGNYTYTRHSGSPDNVEDVFTYTLADKGGALDSARLIIRIDGKEEAKIQDNAQRIVAGNEVITLPAGVELSDIHVVGRDLVIDLPDGTQMVITDGAVFVPQLALGDVELPADTLAQLLIDSEPRPAAGPPQSSGGNFGEPVAPLDPGVPLGDLLPPTEMGYKPPTFEETYIPQKPNSPDFIPIIEIQPDGQPAAIAAQDEVDEAGLNSPPNANPGSQFASDSEVVNGNILFSSPDGVSTITITINGTDYVIYGPGAVSDIPGDYGTLHINDVNVAAGTASYTYTLTHNVNHMTDTTPWEDFSVSLKDSDGDVATATLRINIADDAPHANNDVDSVTEDGPLIADGNVLTGSGGSDANSTDGVADVKGADGASVFSFDFHGTAGTVGGGGLPGAYGSLTLTSGGAYVYTLNNDNPAVQALGVGQTLTEVYHYVLHDGDGTPSDATITITINGTNDRPVIVSGETAVTEEGFVAPNYPGNPDDAGNPGDSASASSSSGDLSITDVDGDPLTVTLSAPAGSFYSHGELISWTPSDGGHTLTGSTSAGPVIVVTITDGGHYTVDLLEQIDHPIHGTDPASSEDIVDMVFGVHANDGTVTTDGSLTVHVEDDSPIINGEITVGSGVDIDESNSGTPVLSPAGAITVTSAAAIISAPVSYGGDGPGGDPVYTITLNGAVEGYKSTDLKTADGDHAITLHQIDATHIEGIFNDGSDHVAFTVTMNANGSITVTQNYALEHSDDGNTPIAYNDTNSPLTLSGLITAHVVYEDFDHDTVEASANIGQLIRFFDDGPSVHVTVQLPEGQALEALALVTGDDGTEGPGSTSDSTTANFGGAFGISASGGADGLASSGLTFDLDLIGAGDGPVNSGLASHGAVIYLYQIDANTIVGSTSATAGGIAEGNTVFQLSTTDMGAVTLTQYMQVDHPIADDPSATGAPFADQFAILDSGLIQLAGTGTATDNDGDYATETQYLDLGGLVRFADDGPAIEASLKEGAHLIVDESLPGTAAGETEPAGTLGQVSVAISTLINVSNTSVSADAPTTYSYGLVLGTPVGGLVDSGLMTSAGDHEIYLYNVGGTIVGSTALSAGAVDIGNTVFTVAISGSNVVLTQYQAIEQGDHPLNYNELSASLASGALGLKVTATDYDGDTATSTVDLGSVIQFNDDGPSAHVTVGALPTDPAALAAFQLITGDDGTEGPGSTSDSTTAHFGGLFGLNADGGSDGIASTSLTFDLDLIGAGDGPVDSGLDSHGANIYLYQIDANTIVGSTSATAIGVGIGNTVFQLSTTDAGAVTLTQFMQIDHPIADDPSATGAPFTDQLAVLDSGLIQLVATGTVTDNDQDVASDTQYLDLGGLVRFADDGPAIEAHLQQGAALHIDESQPGVDNPPSETDAVGLGQVTVALTSLVTFTETSVSADQPVLATGYALNLGPATGGLVSSGLMTSAGDHPIYLYNIGGVIVGSTATDGNVLIANTVFTVAISGANVVMSQYQAIEQLTAGGPGAAHDENSSVLASGALLLTVTATDYDGDTATSSVDLGSVITFGDDGPVVDDRTLPGQQTENADVIVNVTSDIHAGSDGLDHVQYLSTTGTGSVDYDAVNHIFTYHPGSGESGAVTISYRVYDTDGDWDDATISFNIAADSIPVVTAVDLTVDEKGLINGTGELADGIAGNNSDPSEKSATASLTITTGGDSLSKVEIQASNGSWIDVTGATVGSPVIVSGTHGFLTVTSSGGVYSYFYTLTANYPTHPDNDPTDGDGIRGAADPLAGDSFAVKVTDSDGSVSTPQPGDTSVINVTVLDDAPIAHLALKDGATLVIDETDGVAAPGGFEVDAPGGGNLGVATMQASDLYVNTSLFGADSAAAVGATVYTLQVNGSTTIGATVNSGLITSNGNQTIYLYLMSSGEIRASTSSTFAGVADGNTVFKVTIAANGTTTMTQYQAIEHSDAPNNYNESSTVGSIPANAIQVALTVKDGDGDTDKAVVDLGSRIQFLDDGPSAAISISGVGVVHDETPGIQGDANDVGAFTFNVTNTGVDPDGGSPLGYARGTTAISATGTVYGSDSAGTTTVSLSVAPGGVNSGVTTTDGTAIWLFNEMVDGQNVIVGRVGSTALAAQSGVAAFAIRLDGSNQLEMVQYLSVHNPTGGNSYDEPQYLADNVIKATVTATDSDGDKSTASAFLAHNSIGFQDDGPSAAISVANVSVSIDESTGLQADSNDVTGPLAIFANVANKGVDADLGGAIYARSDNNVANATHLVSASGSAYGVDGPGSTVFSISTAGGDSLLKTTEGTSIFLYNEIVDGKNVVVGRAGADAVSAAGGPAAFAIAIDPVTGSVMMVEYLSIQHNLNGLNPDDSVSLAQGAITATVTVTDGDLDTHSVSAAIGDKISFQDSAPVMTSAQNLNIFNGDDVAHTGAFAFNLGADGQRTDFDTIKTVTFSAVVNGVTVQTTTPLTQVSETATTATFNFSFDYDTGTTGTAHETGTIVFHKDTGTYTVDLDNPIAGVSIQSVQGDANGADFYTGGVPTSGSGEVAVSQLGTDFFIQFTGREGVNSPASGFGDNDLWNGPSSTVKISSVAIGVHGNSVQDKDVLDYNFFGTNPGGTISTTPTTSASTVFIKITQFNPNGGGEDFIVTLKLADPSTPGTYIERTFIIDSTDVLTTAPAGYPALGNGEGYIIFEPNDYQALTNVPDNYQIVGMQLRSSNEGVTSDPGQIYNFDGQLGAGHGWDGGTTAFGASTNDNDVFKIIDIGVLRTTTTNQTATLTFNVTVQDGDNDSILQTVTATVTSAPDSTSAATLSATSITPVVLDTNHDGHVGFLGLEAGVLYDVNGDGHLEQTAWAAPGDSILFFDADGNGTVSGASEFVFGHDGMTDLEALHAMYGAQLDANDADFTMFALWNDANSNGIVDAGEVQTLAEAGITSISLVSDGVHSAEAGGDVTVHGAGEFTYVNDNGDTATGKLADAAFAFDTLSAEDEQRLAAGSTNTTLLAAAIAAAGLAGEAAASTTDDDSHDTTVEPLVSVAPTATVSSLDDDDAPQVSPIAGNDETHVVEAAPAAHHNAVVAEESNIVIDGSVHEDASPQALPQGDSAPAVDMTPLVDVAPMTVAAQATSVDGDKGGAHHNAVVVAGDIIQQPDAAIEQVLAKFGGNDAIESLGQVQSGGKAVQGWDMADFGHLPAAVMGHIGGEASLLHPDAVQPVMHG